MKRTTKEDFIAAAKAARARGWTVIRTSSGYVFNAPSSFVEIPTPEHIPANWWGAPTYRRYRQISFSVINDKLNGPWTREAIPWVTANDVKVSLAAGVAFLESE
jgi:hypothetical protein